MPPFARSMPPAAPVRPKVNRKSQRRKSRPRPMPRSEPCSGYERIPRSSRRRAIPQTVFACGSLGVIQTVPAVSFGSSSFEDASRVATSRRVPSRITGSHQLAALADRLAIDHRFPSRDTEFAILIRQPPWGQFRGNRPECRGRKHELFPKTVKHSLALGALRNSTAVPRMTVLRASKASLR